MMVQVHPSLPVILCRVADAAYRTIASRLISSYHEWRELTPCIQIKKTAALFGSIGERCELGLRLFVKDVNSDAVAYGVLQYAMNTEEINGVKDKGNFKPAPGNSEDHRHDAEVQ
jgi:hypothetical protein